MSNIAVRAFKELNVWLTANKLLLNYDKTKFIQFKAKSKIVQSIRITYHNKAIDEVFHTKFLGLIIDNELNWKKHIETIIPKLNSACFALRSLKGIVHGSTLRTVYFALFHSIMKYGIIFWGTSVNADKIFLLQKRAMRILHDVGVRQSCKLLFKNSNILTFTGEYIYSILCYLVDNSDNFRKNCTLHDYNTRSRSDLHRPVNSLRLYQKGCYYSAIQIYNSLPQELKLLEDPKKTHLF